MTVVPVPADFKPRAQRTSAEPRSLPALMNPGTAAYRSARACIVNTRTCSKQSDYNLH
jgi:hypothetical protein